MLLLLLLELLTAPKFRGNPDASLSKDEWIRDGFNRDANDATPISFFICIWVDIGDVEGEGSNGKGLSVRELGSDVSYKVAFVIAVGMVMLLLEEAKLETALLCCAVEAEATGNGVTGDEIRDDAFEVREVGSISLSGFSGEVWKDAMP